MKNLLFLLLSVLILVAGALFAVFMITNSTFSFKNVSNTQTTQDGKIVNTISVSGQGRVFIKPDMATFSVNVTELADASKDAQLKVNERISQVIKIAKDGGVADEDVQTSSFSIYPEYDYPFNATRVFKGYRVSQSLTISVKGLDANGEKLANILDSTAKVEKIEMYGGITFDVFDKTNAYKKARDEAFAKAKSKAEQLASLSGLKLEKPVSISDEMYSSPTPIYYSNMATAQADMVKSSAGSTTTPTGQLEANITVSVVWGVS